MSDVAPRTEFAERMADWEAERKEARTELDHLRMLPPEEVTPEAVDAAVARARRVTDAKPRREDIRRERAESKQPYPPSAPSNRGDEHLCAYCATRQGVDVDHEGRLLCRHVDCKKAARKAARRAGA